MILTSSNVDGVCCSTYISLVSIENAARSVVGIAGPKGVVVDNNGGTIERAKCVVLEDNSGSVETAKGVDDEERK